MPAWFVRNVADSPALAHERAGVVVRLEPPDAPFADFGINVRVLQPGQPNAKYHAESVQEGLLVLAGECLAILDGEERPLRAWDYVHLPAGTHHVIVGAGDGPCAVLMVGARREGKRLDYPGGGPAARHGAAAPAPTTRPDEAYADWPPEFTPTEVDWPPG